MSVARMAWIWAAAALVCAQQGAGVRAQVGDAVQSGGAAQPAAPQPASRALTLEQARSMARAR